MFDIAFVYVFTVGMAAAFNPCGAAMFPAYVGYQLGTVEADEKPITTALRGVLMGLVATAGFVVVFGIVGIVLAAGGRVIRDVLPFVGLGIGILIAGTGLWLLISRQHIGSWPPAASTSGRAGG